LTENGFYSYTKSRIDQEAYEKDRQENLPE
jgi:hypothetical protein